MKFDVLLVGFGVIGTEALSKLVNDYKNKKKLKIAILDRNINNIPGGIAYSKVQSKFGFFNNPLRLSNPEFIKWIKKRKNIIKIKKFITNNKNFNLTNWLNKNKVFDEIKVNKINEIYLPRLTYSFFLEEKIKNFLKKIKRKNICIDLIEGELIDLKDNQGYTCTLKKNSNSFKFLLTSKNFRLKKMTKKNYSISTKNIIIGNGILPPQKIKEKIFNNNNNYIWDFYSEGGTQNLLKMLKKMVHFKKLIKILFIGNKAGLLEALPEIENFSKKTKSQLKIISFAPNSLSLERAELSIKHSEYKFKFLKKNDLKKINKARQIFSLLNKEFNNAKKNWILQIRCMDNGIKKKNFK